MRIISFIEELDIIERILRQVLNIFFGIVNRKKPIYLG